MRSPHPPRSQRRTRRQAVVAVACSLLAVTAVQLSTTAAGAAPWWGTTTTTKKATTTTTKKPTTTTTAKPTTTTTTRPTTTTTAPPAPTCGGLTTVARSDGSGTWTCSFGDEFSGSTLDRTKWLPMTTYGTWFSSGGQDCFLDDPRNVSVSDGTLVLTSRREAAPFQCAVTPTASYTSQYTSGMVSTHGRFQQTYGRWEVRARVLGAKQPGTQEAIWLWPVDDTKYGPSPASGEIDIAEVYGQYPDRAIPYVHYNNTADSNVTNTSCMIDDISQFHTYVLEWTPEVIRITYDGQTCLEDRWSPAAPLVDRQPFDQPFFLNLTQGLGLGTNGPTDALPMPASTVIDYVRVYK